MILSGHTCAPSKARYAFPAGPPADRGIERHALEVARKRRGCMKKLQQVLIALGAEAEPDELFARAELP